MLIGSVLSNPRGLIPESYFDMDPHKPLRGPSFWVWILIPPLFANQARRNLGKYFWPISVRSHHNLWDFFVWCQVHGTHTNTHTRMVLTLRVCYGMHGVFKYV